MAMMIIRHRVRNFEAWRPAYDAHESARKAADLTNGQVFRSADDPDDLGVDAHDVLHIPSARGIHADVAMNLGGHDAEAARV